MQVTHSSQALVDLEDIYDLSLAFWGDIQATSYLSGLRNAISNFQHFPKIGESRSDLGPYVSAFTHASHVIVYDRISEDEILILRVVHSRRRLTRRILFAAD